MFRVLRFVEILIVHTVITMAGFAMLPTEQLMAQTTITAAEAKNHVREQVTVCGKIVDTLFAGSRHGRPTFLDVDKPYYDRLFVVLIWGTDRSKFGEPETTYLKKQICVTGEIRDYKGLPMIVAVDPSQVKMQ